MKVYKHLFFVKKTRAGAAAAEEDDLFTVRVDTRTEESHEEREGRGG